MEQRIAIPVVNGLLSAHFGHCQFFFIADVVDGEIKQTKEVSPPPHEPGVIPRWLSQEGVNVVLVGGIGQKAVDLFVQFGVQPVIGVSEKQPLELINDFVSDKLVVGANQCSH
ncbi:NifB/NifX family molybdenum-iron cluster-binding protein [Marinilabilia sp.]|uniref:NifB/NifX family molybdenum-iron cluster-binding protein n=1 Tax=Marinilabilia sp. TaxID=2021252 RepID=UPI0025BEFBCD|nr:NifB/NifX family molybdenum-iron cluster-binding protein [Marinilabilia sp.]